VSSYRCSIDSPSQDILLDHAFTTLESLGLPESLWARRLDIWTSDSETQQKIANRLGWLHAVEFARRETRRLEAFADSVRTAGFTDVVLLGMGGSSLAPEVMARVFGVAAGQPRFHMLDSVNPAAVRQTLAMADTSLFVLASKSGSTIEPNSLAAEARRRVEASGYRRWGDRFVAITDEGTDLHVRATREGFREVFVNPSDIGGRYSALSLFGLVPAALIGVPLGPFMQHAAALEAECRETPPRQNPGLILGAFMSAAAQQGRDKLTLILPDQLASLGLWIEQLVAESTGKQGQGVVPIADEPEVPRYRRDRAGVVVQVGDTPTAPLAVARLRESGAPVVTVRIPDVTALGAEFLRWQVATAATGLLLGVNPFDEPNVQQAKDATRAILSVYSREHRLPTRPPHATFGNADLTLSTAAEQKLTRNEAFRFLSLCTDGDYIALLSYISPFDEASARVIVDARAEIARRTGYASAFGYGPRYLHSTGQLHKGGPDNGVFIIITIAPQEDLPVPGEPYSFGVLESAQALGDFASLDQSGRRALHVHLTAPGVGALASIFQRLLAFL